MNENRYSFIAAFPKRGGDWNFTEIGNVETLRGPLRSAAGKNLMVFSTAVADEVAHILDNADDRNHHFVEHRLGSNDIRERNVVSPRQNGHKRIYMPEEVVEISVIAELRRKGFSLQKIRRVLRFLQKDMGKRLSEAIAATSDVHLLTDGKRLYLETSARQIVDILKNSSQPILGVCLSEAVRPVRAEIVSRKLNTSVTSPDSRKRARKAS